MIKILINWYRYRKLIRIEKKLYSARYQIAKIHGRYSFLGSYPIEIIDSIDHVANQLANLFSEITIV